MERACRAGAHARFGTTGAEVFHAGVVRVRGGRAPKATIYVAFSVHALAMGCRSKCGAELPQGFHLKVT